MTTIEAVYEGGVFKPVGPVELPERQRVQLSISPVAPTPGLDWLEEMRRERARVAAAYGPFPDTTALIAKDRRTAMADTAVDANILIKWVIQEPDSGQADALAAAVMASGGDLITLDLALVEAANVLCTLVRQGPLPATEAARLFGLLASRPLRIVAAGPLLPRAIDLAARNRLTVYDALFVALTIDLGIDGVTADEPLVKAVRTDHPQVRLLRSWTAPPSSATP